MEQEYSQEKLHNISFMRVKEEVWLGDLARCGVVIRVSEPEAPAYVLHP
jgi:hypothetical protein